MVSRIRLVALILGCLFATAAGGAQSDPSPTAVPPTPIPPKYDPQLVYEFDTSPENPQAGEAFSVTFRADLVNGVGGIPRYSLIAPGLEASGPHFVWDTVFGNDVTFEVVAMRAELHLVRLAVTFDFGVPDREGDCCVWLSRSEWSPQFELDVGGIDTPPTTTPTPTPPGATPTPTFTSATSVPETYRLTVHVGVNEFDQTGAIAGAQVELDPLGIVAVSDTTGTVVFEDVPGGDYTLLVSGPAPQGLFCSRLVRVQQDLDFEACGPGCSKQVRLTPSAGPPGTTVVVEGKCEYIHSGGRADLNFGPVLVGTVMGQTGGDFIELFVVPHLPAGTYEVEAAHGVAPFTLTGNTNVCAGDCDGNMRVQVDELVRAVGIALGTIEPGTCPVFSGGAAIVDLVRAVRSSLEGCSDEPAPSPNPKGTFGEGDHWGRTNATSCK